MAVRTIEARLIPALKVLAAEYRAAKAKGSP